MEKLSSVSLGSDGSAETGIPGHQNKKGLSVLTAILFITTEVAGSGVLSLPRGIASTGWSGVFILIISGIIASYSGVCLGRCWLILEERWPEYRGPVRNPFACIGFRAGGKWMSFASSSVMDITFFGGSVVYLLLCTELVWSLTGDIIKGVTFCDWILILALLLLPLSWFGSPADFWPLAVGAVGTTLLGLILLMTNVILDSPQYKPQVTYQSPTFKSFFIGTGTIVFSFGGAAAFPTFQNDMKDKTKFPTAVIFGFILLLVLYIPVSIAGYAVYGSAVNIDILGSVSEGWLKTSISILFAIHLFLAFLVLINPVAQEFETLVNIPQHFTYKRLITRSMLMIGITFTALSVPQFGKILSLIGSSSITLMTFILPPIFYIRLVSKQNDNKEWPKRRISIYVKIFLIVSIIIGIVAGIAATYSSIYDLVDPKALKPPCYVNLQYFYKS